MDYGKGEQTGPRLCRHRTHLRLRVTVLKTKLAGGQVAGNNQKQQRRILLQQELTDQSLWGISPGILLVNYLKMLGTLKDCGHVGMGVVTLILSGMAEIHKVVRTVEEF